MTDRAMNWLFYTCLLAAAPIICRFVVWLTATKDVVPITTADVIIFGLVIHSANINEVNRIAGADLAWRTLHNGTSTLFLMVYAVLLYGAIAESSEVNDGRVLITSLLMGVVSIILGVSVIRRADALDERANQNG